MTDKPTVQDSGRFALRILVIEDSPGDTDPALGKLRDAGYEIVTERVDSDRDLRVALLRSEWDLVLCDSSPGRAGVPAALAIVGDSRRELPLIVLSGTPGEEPAIEAMRAGADDYVMKDRLDRLVPAVRRAIEEADARRAQRQGNEDLGRRQDVLAAVGSAAARFLDPNEWEAAVPDLLARIGESIGASRVSVYESREDVEGELRASLRFEWSAPDVAPRLGSPILQSVSPRAHGFDDLFETLRRGEPVHGTLLEAEQPLRGFLESIDVGSYAIVPIFTGTALWGLISVSLTFADHAWSSHEMGGLESAAGVLSGAIHRAEALRELERAYRDLARSYDATLESLSRAFDLRDHDIEGHSRRVTQMTVRLARSMGIGESDIVHIRRGALLHDIGKLGIPDGILTKAGPLSEEEWKLVRLHPLYAYEYLSQIPVLRPAIDIPYAHHERWDGKGYPRGLAGEKIPIAARIFAVVDVWDALSYNRPYRAAIPSNEVQAHIRAAAGTHFDPAVVEAFEILNHWSGTTTLAGGRTT